MVEIGKILKALTDNNDGRRIELAEIDADGRRSPAKRDAAKAKVEGERDAKHAELIAQLANPEAIKQLVGLLDDGRAKASTVAKELAGLAVGTLGGADQPDVLAGLLGRRELLVLQQGSVLRLLTQALPVAAAQRDAETLAAHNIFYAGEIVPREKRQDELKSTIRVIQARGITLQNAGRIASRTTARLDEVPALKGQLATVIAELEALYPRRQELDTIARFARARAREVRGLVVNGRPEEAAHLFLDGRASRNATSRSQSKAPADA